MTNSTLTIAEVRNRLSANALGCLQAVARTADDQDAMIASDLALADRSGLLATCLSGAEGADVVAGWTEYVAVVEKIAAGNYHQGR